MATEYTSLRVELKQWEKSFQTEHGRKATPDDIRLVQGLADKYKRFKNLSKSSAQQQQPTSKAAVPSKPIIMHSKPTENERDPLPPSARPNPFSPVKRTTGAQSAKSKPSTEFPSFPNLLASPTKRSYATTRLSPPGSPNPFLSVPSIRAQPDSPYTAARKRIRGEGEGEDSNDAMSMRPDKRRRSGMNRSVSASTTGAAPGLFASGAGACGSGVGNLFGLGNGLDLSAEVLEESPVKQSTLNGAVYKPIFDDDNISLRASSTSGRGITRTVSAPVASFFGRKVDARDSQPSSRATDSEPGPGVQPLRLGDEDEQMGEDEPVPNVSLLAPTPVKGGDKNGRWKSKTTAKSRKGREDKSKLNVDEEDEDKSDGDDPHHSELAVMEVGWKTMGPLHTGALAGDKDEEMEDAGDENFRLLPARPLWSMSRRVAQDDQEEEPESVQIDVADEMRDVLQLSPAKSKIDDERLVQDILSGKGDRTKRAEVWLPGDGGDESDDWESEGPGWWEAEL